MCNTEETTKAKPRELNSEFLGFTGTEKYYRYSPLFPHHLTDGTKHIADKIGLYWFFDTLLSYQMYAKVKAIHFQTWTLARVQEGKNKGRWEVILYNGKEPILKQLFVSIMLENDYEEKFDIFTVYLADGIVFLPSEY